MVGKEHKSRMGVNADDSGAFVEIGKGEKIADAITII